MTNLYNMPKKLLTSMNILGRYIVKSIPYKAFIG